MIAMDTSKHDSILERLTEQLSVAAAHPFLFVGSGFSKRYLGLPSWSELLSVFCAEIKPFKYYLAKSDNNLPAVASLMVDDYFEYAWKDNKKSTILQKHNFQRREDVLKFFICEYIRSSCVGEEYQLQHQEEIKKLEKLSIDAIITTNWDCYLENIFPDYSTYVGQDELVVANPYGIGEIYKIHGSVKYPSSLVLTKEDYHEFNKKYAYLAAKLITYLIEHPVIFIGYSIQDENIKKILESLAMCLGSSVQDRLQNNLIFVQRNGLDRIPGIESTRIKIQDHHIPLTTITTDDFGIIYDAIGTIKRKIPVRVLRFLKEEIYEITKSHDPKSKICVADIDEIEDKSKIEFVVGIGVKEMYSQYVKSVHSKIGYRLPMIEEILLDVINSDDDKSIFEVEMLLSGTLPHYMSSSANTPIFKYLKIVGINSDEAYKAARYQLDRAYGMKFNKYRTYSQLSPNFEVIHDFHKIVQNNSPQRAAILIPHLNPNEIDIQGLKSFLKEHADEWNNQDSDYRSYFRKLVSIYDRLKFGWVGSY